MKNTKYKSNWSLNQIAGIFLERQKLILQSERNRLPITYVEKLKSKNLEKKFCIPCVYAQAKFAIEFIRIPYSPTGPKRQQIATMSIVGYE